MSTATSKLNISKVGRVCVTVADTDRALDFYVGKLGFEKVVDEPMGPGMRWVEVAVSGAETTIALAPPPEGQQAGFGQCVGDALLPVGRAHTQPANHAAVAG